MKAIEESKNDRLLMLLRATLDVSRGTLWWVRDSIWASVVTGWIPRKVNPKKGRHSGISLGRPPVTSVVDTIPMLVGTTKKHGFGVVVHGLGPERGEKAATHYALRPYALQVRDCVGSEPAIARNTYKTRLSASELSFLNLFLAKKGAC